MSQIELLIKIAELLELAGLEYMITGAYSVIYYARPRTSHDLDFVVDLQVTQIDKLLEKLSLIPDLVVQREAIEEGIKNKSYFQGNYFLSGDKVDFWFIKDIEFERVMFSRRKEVSLRNKLIFVSSPEDTILQKLRWYKKGNIEKHIVDAAFVWQLQENLDMEYINKWVEKLEVADLFGRLDEVNLEEHY